MKNWLELADLTLSLLFILDLIFLIGSLLIDLEHVYYSYVMSFDLILCILLIITFILKLLYEDDKKGYFRENWIDLIAAIPIQLFIIPSEAIHVPVVNIMLLLRLVRILVLFKQSSKLIKKFFNATSVDKMVALFVVVVTFSIYTLFYLDPAIQSMYDAVWFVFQTITTVGYGDVIPKSPVGQFIAMILLVLGVLLFSVVTASFSYLFTDKAFRKENEGYNKKLNSLKEGLRESRDSLEEVRKSHESTDGEISEIKEKILSNEESIRRLDEKMDHLIDLLEKDK